MPGTADRTWPLVEDLMNTLILGTLASLILLFGAGGCQYVQNHAPRVESGPYSGPGISIISFAAQHQIVVTTPTGGWDVGLDQARLAGQQRQVFITATRPARDQMVTQAFQDHELNSTVDSRTSIEIFVRIVERGGDPADFPYRLAAQSGR
jgi:hypothetical protein